MEQTDNCKLRWEMGTGGKKLKGLAKEHNTGPMDLGNGVGIA